MHVAIRFCGFVETNAAIVRVAHESCELFLPEFALHLTAHAAGAESEARDFHVGFSEGDPFCRGVFRDGLERRCGSERNCACGERSCLEKVTARLTGSELARHGSPHTGKWHCSSIEARSASPQSDREPAAAKPSYYEDAPEYTAVF